MLVRVYQTPAGELCHTLQLWLISTTAHEGYWHLVGFRGTDKSHKCLIVINHVKAGTGEELVCAKADSCLESSGLCPKGWLAIQLQEAAKISKEKHARRINIKENLYAVCTGKRAVSIYSYTNSNPPSMYRIPEVLWATKGARSGGNHSMSYFCPVLILVNLALLCIVSKQQDLKNFNHLLS